MKCELCLRGVELGSGAMITQKGDAYSFIHSECLESTLNDATEQYDNIVYMLTAEEMKDILELEEL